MDLFPLWNSLRVAAISTVIVFFAGIFAAYYIARLPRLVKGVLDVVLTLPLVLPPTLAGYLLLHVLDPNRLWKSLPFFRACSPQSCSLRRILRARAQTPAPYRQEYPAGSMAAGCARRCRCWKAPTSCWSKQAPRQMLRMHRAPSGI